MKKVNERAKLDARFRRASKFTDIISFQRQLKLQFRTSSMIDGVKVTDSTSEAI